MHTSGGASRPLRAATLLVAHEADLLTVERILCDPWISGEQLQHGGLRHSSVGSPSRGFSSLIDGRCLLLPRCLPL